MKHIPLRSCIVCREQKAKADLIRIVRSSDGAISLDKTGAKSGRGAYVCKSKECIDTLVKKNVLNRVYKEQIPKTAYDALYEQLKESLNDAE